MVYIEGSVSKTKPSLKIVEIVLVGVSPQKIYYGEII